MSSESLAAFRKSVGKDYARIAEDHFKHDLTQSDRDTLKSAAGKLSTFTTAGSIIGLSLGIFLSFRLRTGRRQMFDAFKAREKPTHVKFADGREEAIPDLTNMLKPTTFGDIFTYTFFGAGGLFIGGESGLLLGGWSAGRQVKSDPDSAKRIEQAFRGFRADVLKKEAELLDKGTGSPLDKYI